MKTRTRLAFLLGLLLLAFGGGAWILHRQDKHEARELFTAQKEERARLLGSLLQLTNDSLRNFARDYAEWDDMVNFVGTGDPAWGEINLEAILPNFNVKAVWVHRLDGSLVYGVARPAESGLRSPPFDLTTLLPRLQQEGNLDFFVQSPEGLLEIRATAVKLSEVETHHLPPRGWFVAARAWDARQLKSLGDVMASEISLLPPGAEPAVSGEEFDIGLRRELPGRDGRPVAVLHTRYYPAPFARLQAHNNQEMLFIAGFGVVVLVVTLAALSVWVLAPLHRIEQSLEENSASPLGPLRRKQDEFGRLARLTEAFFTSRAALEKEVEERMRVEVALRRSTQLRTRLARDLHDSVIQSIYAAGLGLETVRSLLRSDPDLAEKRLGAAVASLNQTIGQVRSFINGLEPEHEPQPQFSLALRSLVETLQGLHPLRIDLAIAAPATSTLTVQEELHALQIARECVSNSLRHSNATRVEISLRQQDERTVLSVADDGKGFVPATVSGHGRGLANIAARCHEMGARLEIDSAPGKGCRVAVWFGEE